MSFGFAFIGKDLDTRCFQSGNAKELEIGSAIASHQYLSKLDDSKFVHISTNTTYTGVTEKDGIYFILNFLFPAVPPSSSLLDLIPFLKLNGNAPKEYFTDYFLKSDIENALTSLINVYLHTGNPQPFILNESILDIFVDSNLKLESIVHSKLEKLRSDIYWTPRFKKSKNNILPLMHLDQNLNIDCNIPTSLVKYLVFQIMNKAPNEFPKYLCSFKRPSQCRLNFISDLDIDNNYYIFTSQIDSEKKTCIWIPIPFIIVVFTVANRENLSEIIQEIESDLSLMQRMCDTHNSILKSFKPENKEIKKKVQYCFYPDTTSYLFGKYLSFYIRPDTFAQTPCKINMNVAHVVTKLVRRYLLSFQDSNESKVIAKPQASRILNEKKLGASSTQLMNFWIIHKDKILALAFGSTNSIIRSCPSGVNLDNMPISQFDVSLQEATKFLKSFERSFIQ